MTTPTNPPTTTTTSSSISSAGAGGGGKHFNPNPDAVAPAAPADAGWLRLSAALSAQIPPVAGRDDLIVVCEPGAGHGAPACLIREQACVEIDGTYLDRDPTSIDAGDPDAREQFPVLWGLLVHEAAHGQHTCWDFGTGEPAAAEAATTLEESRIEAAQIRRRPGDRRWLRAATTKILLAEVPTTDDVWSAATTAALILARVDAGVLDPDEVQPVRDVVTGILTSATLDQLTRIWRQAHTTDDFDTDTMVELGRRWCAVLGIKPDDTTIPPLGGPPATAGSPGGPGAPGGGAGGNPAGGGALRRAAGKAVVIVADHDGEEAKAQADAEQRAAQKAAARDAETRAQTRAGAASGKVFGNPGGVGPGTGQTGGVRRNPPTPSTRAATEAERTAARQLARALRAAAHREPSETIVAAPTPPGRLRARAAMSGDAQRAMGQQPTAQPWRRTERRRHPTPPIQVGICVDVSPSVSAFAGPIAAAAWITAQATAWAGGTSATITFGQYVTPVTQPGQPPAQVRLFDIEGDTAGFPLAVDALDGALGLANPRAGARLLVVVSDGEFSDTEKVAGQQRLDRLLRAGCALLWLAPPGCTPLTGGQQVVLTDPARSGQVIARAATAALAAHT